jgi:RNA polymerase sigma-70 factor (ECF subfamily)
MRSGRVRLRVPLDPEVRGGSKLSTWLHRIVVNNALMKLRSHKRHPEEAIDDLLPAFEADGHATQPSTQWSASAEDIVARHEMRDIVRKNIDLLPDSYRVVLLIAILKKCLTEETAQALGITAAAVKVRLHRARQALRTMLDKDTAGEPSDERASHHHVPQADRPHSRFDRGALDDFQAEDFQLHLALCVSCQAYLASYVTTIRVGQVVLRFGRHAGDVEDW